MAVAVGKKVTTLDAIHMLVDAWKEVNQATVKYCFSKAFSYPDGAREERGVLVNLSPTT